MVENAIVYNKDFLDCRRSRLGHPEGAEPDWLEHLQNVFCLFPLTRGRPKRHIPFVFPYPLSRKILHPQCSFKHVEGRIPPGFHIVDQSYRVLDMTFLEVKEILSSLRRGPYGNRQLPMLQIGNISGQYYSDRILNQIIQEPRTNLLHCFEKPGLHRGNFIHI